MREFYDLGQRKDTKLLGGEFGFGFELILVLSDLILISVKIVLG